MLGDILRIRIPVPASLSSDSCSSSRVWRRPGYLSCLLHVFFIFFFIAFPVPSAADYIEMSKMWWSPRSPGPAESVAYTGPLQYSMGRAVTREFRGWCPQVNPALTLVGPHHSSSAWGAASFLVLPVPALPAGPQLNPSSFCRHRVTPPVLSPFRSEDSKRFLLSGLDSDW